MKNKRTYLLAITFFLMSLFIATQLTLIEDFKIQNNQDAIYLNLSIQLTDADKGKFLDAVDQANVMAQYREYRDHIENDKTSIVVERYTLPFQGMEQRFDWQYEYRDLPLDTLDFNSIENKFIISGSTEAIQQFTLLLQNQGIQFVEELPNAYQGLIHLVVANFWSILVLLLITIVILYMNLIFGNRELAILLLNGYSFGQIVKYYGSEMIRVFAQVYLSSTLIVMCLLWIYNGFYLGVYVFKSLSIIYVLMGVISVLLLAIIVGSYHLDNISAAIKKRIAHAQYIVGILYLQKMIVSVVGMILLVVVITKIGTINEYNQVLVNIEIPYSQFNANGTFLSQSDLAQERKHADLIYDLIGEQANYIAPIDSDGITDGFYVNSYFLQQLGVFESGVQLYMYNQKGDVIPIEADINERVAIYATELGDNLASEIKIEHVKAVEGKSVNLSDFVLEQPTQNYSSITYVNNVDQAIFVNIDELDLSTTFPFTYDVSHYKFAEHGAVVQLMEAINQATNKSIISISPASFQLLQTKITLEKEVQKLAFNTVMLLVTYIAILFLIYDYYFTKNYEYNLLTLLNGGNSRKILPILLVNIVMQMSTVGFITYNQTMMSQTMIVIASFILLEGVCYLLFIKKMKKALISTLKGAEF